jgi:phosphoribosylformylglycinamidine synthase
MKKISRPGDEMNNPICTRRDLKFPFTEIDLKRASDGELLAISEEMGLSLSLDEMRKVKDHFVSKGRDPTDVELQSIGQAWSEHCCYKSSKPILREFVFGIDRDYVIARGDAGVVEFDREWAYALRIESHNHPSAVEPYGGAATGIGGIVRDVLAMGCQPIALIDPLFFGPLDYPNRNLPSGTKHPKYLFGGIISGIRDYGNRIGIPTVAGCAVFDPSYVGNCIVNVGCVGIARKDHVLKNAVKSVGDVLILAGGRTGRDGIHGVTFASRVLSDKSEADDRGAVQLGDPITKEPLIHACLEANDAELLNGLKDLGGGGLSCVVGELALAAGFGAEVDLNKVPLKEEGLAPWEIWVSESQERMMLAVSPENVESVLKIFSMYDVLATPVGKVIETPSVRLFYGNVQVFDMELDFLTKGPEYCRSYATRLPGRPEQAPRRIGDFNKILSSLLSDPNIACKDWIIRQYDHEVRAGTVIKPLQGDVRSPTHGDAVVLRPVEGSYQGLALAVAANPFVTGIDPYIGGKTIVDEMCRNLVAVGAEPHSFTNCLNFGNPEKPEKMAEFYGAVKGMGEVASALGIPIPSGNVSFYNESKMGAVLPTATVLGAGIVRDIRKCVTVDFKKEGNPIYLVGMAGPEMGGSAFYRLAGGWSGKVPDVDITVLKRRINALRSVIEDGLVVSCHDISDGGLAVAISECCIGGGTGATLDFFGNVSWESELFSESPTRWIIEGKKGCEKELETRLRGIDILDAGKVGGDRLVIKNGRKTAIDKPVRELEQKWRTPIWKIMG